MPFLNLSSNITVGDTTSSGASLTVSGNADINIPGAGIAGNIFIGRGTSTGALFTMTGGTIDLGNLFRWKPAPRPAATGIVGNHSGGTITSTSNFVLADSLGSATYNLSAAGVINAHGLVLVGRRNGTAIMNQMGGTVTTDLGVSIGNAQAGATTTYATGTYNVSGGIINANQTTGTALAIAPLGNAGTFRVIGDDADINVNGNMTVNSASGIVGTLAYQLESGDSLSVIDVTGTATFSSGAILDFEPLSRHRRSLRTTCLLLVPLLTTDFIQRSGLGISDCQFHTVGQLQCRRFYQHRRLRHVAFKRRRESIRATLIFARTLTVPPEKCFKFTSSPRAHRAHCKGSGISGT